MELELGLKVTRTREDVSSSVDFRFSKDPFGPLVLSRETDSRFIIIIHLKGFKKEGVEIDINKEGDSITIRGRKPVEEMVMIRWMAWMKEVEMREFKKVFLIPDVVDLDKIKARFDDDDATLTIIMPKRVEGISGFNLEQEEEEEEEGVESGDVSEVENREEVEEEDEEREESDEHSEIQGEEDFGEIVEDEERESQVYEGEEEGFSGGVDETKVEDNDLEEIQQTGQQELADSDREREDNVLKKLPDIMKQEDNQEVMEKKISEETKSERIGSGATEEIEEQESDGNSVSDTKTADSGLEKLPDITEQEDNHQEVIKQKVSEETNSGYNGSEAVEEIEEQESDGNSVSDTKSKDSGLTKLPDMIEQDDNQELMEQKVSGEAESDDIGSGATEEIEEQESDEDSGLEKLPDKIEQADNQEVMEQKVLEEPRSEDIGSEAVEEIEEQESDLSSNSKKLPEIIEQEDNQKVREQKVSEETKSDKKGSGAVEVTQEQESHEDSALKNLPEIIEQEDNQELMEKKVSEETKSEGIGSGAVEDFQEQDSDGDNGLKKFPDIIEQKENHEGREHKVSVETKIDDNGSGAVEEIEEQESNEIGGTSKSREMEKKETDGGDDDGVRKAQGKEEPERHKEERKIQEMVEEETGGQEKDAEEESDEKETQIEDDNLEKSQQTDEQETVGQHDFADSNTESEDSVLRKLPDILEQENNQDVMEQKDSQEETRSDDFGSRESEEIEKQEPHEQLDGTSKSRSNADDDGLSKVQGVEKPERRNEVRKIQEMVEGDPKEDVDAEMGEGFTPNIERPKVVAETEPKAEEYESENLEAGKDNTKVRRESGDRRSLTKFQENEEQRSKGPNRQDKQENIKELVEEKAPEAETSIENDVKPVQETEAPEVDTVVETNDEGKEKKGVKMETAPNVSETETKSEDFESEKQGADEVDKIHKLVENKEEKDDNVRAKSDERSLMKLQENEEKRSKGRKQQDKQENNKELLEEKAPEAETSMGNDVPKPVKEMEVPNIVETETKLEEFESDKLEADEVDKIHKLVEKKKEEDENNAEVGTQSEDIGSIKPQEVGQQQSQGQKQYHKCEKIKELVEEKTPEAEETIGNDTPRPVQERCEGTNNTDSRKTQETIRQQELDECEKESKTQELVKSKTNEEVKEEKETETETEEQESCRPKVLGEEEKIQELAAEKPHFSKHGKVKEEEELPEKKTELGDDDISRKAGDSDAKEEVDGEMEKLFAPKIAETETKPDDISRKEEVDAEMGKGFAPSVAETETKPAKTESEELGPDEVEKEEEVANVRRKSEDRSLMKLQEDEEPHSKGRKRQEKQEGIKELVEEKAPEAEKNVASYVLKPVQEIGQEMVTLVAGGDEGKEKKKSVHLEVKNKDDSEELNANLSVPNAAETETKPEEFESEKLGADEVDKIYELVEKKKEEEEGKNAKVETQSEETSLLKPQEVGEQQSQGQKRHKKIKELVGEKNPEAETTIENDTPKQVQDTEAPEVGTVVKTDDERKKGKEKKKSVKVIGEGFAPNTTETETKPEDIVSEKQGASEVNKLHKPVEKKEEEEEDANVRAKGEDSILTKLQENEEKYSKERKRQEKQENIKELMEEKAPDVVSNIAETETKPEEFVPDKLKEIDKIYELVGKKEDEEDEKSAKDGTESEETSLLKPQEIGEQQSQGQKQQGEQEKIEEEKTPEAETSVAKDTWKPVQERGEGEQKIQKNFQEEKKKQPEDFKEKMPETGKKINDAVSREVQEIIRQQKLDEAERCEKESKTQEVVKSKTNDEEKEKEETGTGETETKERDSYKPKILWEEGITEKKTKFGDDDHKILRRVGDTGDSDSDSKEEVDAEMGNAFKPNIAETGTKAEEFETQKMEPDEVDEKDDIHEVVEDKEEEEKNAKVRRQSEDSNFSKKLQEAKEQQFQAQKRHNKQEKMTELMKQKTPATCEEKGISETDRETREQESSRPKVLGEQEQVQELSGEKTDFLKTSKAKEEEEIAEKKTEFGEDDHYISRKVGDTGQRDSYAKEEVDPEMGEGFTPNISETEKKSEEFESDTVKEVEEDRKHESVEKKKKEENDKVRKKSEDANLKRLQEEKFQGPNHHRKQEKIKELVEEKQETEKPKVEGLETCEEKVFPETETKDQESYRQKILEGEDKIQELAEEKAKFSRRLEEEEETAEKKTELGDDDISRKYGDIDAMKGQEEKEKIQELALEEKASDGGKKDVEEALPENDKSRKVQKIDEQKSHEEDERGNQVQELIEGETSGQGDVKGVESEKKTTKVDKRFREAKETERPDSDVSGKYVKGELQEEAKGDEDDRPKRGTGTPELELVNLNSQMEQEAGEKTEELVDEKINNGKKEESETKTDDVIRKVQGIKEPELSEPKRGHVSKIEEVTEEKPADPETEPESSGVSKVYGSEEQELHEPSGQERGEEEKEKVAGSMRITEKESSPTAQKIKDQRADKESTKKQYKIQELVEGEDNDHKADKLTVNAKQETEEETSKGDQETEEHESDGLSSSVVQDTKKETEEKEINRAEERTKTEDVSLRKFKDDEDPERSKPYKRQEEDKIQEPMGMGTSDYREEVKKKDGDDTLRSQEPGKQNLDELERHSEQKNIPQEEDKIQEPVEMTTHDDREKVKKHDVPQSVREEKVESDLEEKVEDDGSDKFHEIEERKSYEDWTHETREKRKDFGKEEAIDPNESEEKDKTRAVEEKGIVERRTGTRDGSLIKFQDDAEPEMSKPYKPQEEDKGYESVEKGTSDYREEVKKQDGNDTSRSKQNLVKEEATSPKYKRTAEAGHKDHKEEQEEERNIAKAELKAEEDTVGKIQEIEKQKSDELRRPLVQDKLQETEEKEKTRAMEENESAERSDYRGKVKTQDGDDILRSQETRKLDLVEEEATGPKDKHIGGKGEPGQERYEEVLQTERKVEDETNKEVEENQNEKEMDDSVRKTQESEKEESHEPEIHETLDIVKDFVEEEADEAAAAEANYDEDSSRILQTIKQHEQRKEQRNDPGDKERIAEKKTKEKEAYDDWTQEERGMMRDLVREEAFDLKHTGGEGHNDHKDEQHEKKIIPKAEVKAEEDSSEQEFDELQRSLVQEKMQETEEKGKLRSTEEKETVEGRTKTEDGSLRKAEEGEDPELSRHKRHEEELKKEDEDGTTTIEETEKEESEELNIVQNFVEDKTWEQEDDRVGEAAAVVENNEEDSSGNLHTTTGGEELKEHEEQDEIPATSDPRVKEEDGERVTEKETEMEKVHVQEPGGKTENEESRRGQKGKQEKNDETRSDDGIVRKAGETKVQESDEKKDQEPGGQIEEPERKEASNDGVKLETEVDSLIKGREFIEKDSSNRPEVGQENIQQHMDAEEQEDEGKSDAEVEMQDKIKEEKGIEGSDKVAEVEMQAKIGIRMKEKETKRQELYELLENEEHDKIPEPVVEGTKYQREKEKRVENREAEEMKRKAEDVSSRKVQKTKAEETDGLQKHRKLSELQEHQPVEEKELNEAGWSKAVLKTKSMEDSRQSQDVEERGPDQTEQENIQKIMAKEEEEEEHNEKAERMQQVESKAKDDSSKKNETERLRGHKQHKDHQEVVEIETSDQRKEEREDKIDGKAVTRDEYDNSRNNQEHEEEQSDKLGRLGDEEIRRSLPREETSKDKEKNRGNRADAETTIKDDKKQLVMEKDTSGKEKETRNRETKSRDDSSRENEKQESHEQKRYYEEQDKKKLGPNYYRSEEDVKEDKEIPEAEGIRKSKGIEQREATKMVERHDYQDNITDLVEEQSDKPERLGEEEISREETSNDKEENRGNRAGAETTIKDDGFREEQLEIVLRHSEQDKKQLVVEKDTSGKAKDKRNQETKSKDESSRKARENEKQEPHQQKRYFGEQEDKKNMGPDYYRNDEEFNITDLVEEKMKNQEKEDKRCMFMEVLEKSKDHESQEPERLRKQDKGSELVPQRSTDNLQDEETKVKDKESRKIHEQHTEQETGVKEKENRETECEGGSSKKIKEIDKEGSSEPKRDEKRDKIQPVDSETSEDDSEELEVEVEDSEEDWDAEVIQEMDSDEDNDKLRKIRRIKLGFRLVGGSTLFMSFIVIVISIIRSKRKTRCYKF